MESMDALLEGLRRAADEGLLPRGGSVLLAVSGGADSMALLYAAVELLNETAWRLHVAHVHHGWRRREADRDLAFVAEHARRLGLPFLSRRHDARRAAKSLGLSPEAGARHVRYAALVEMAAEAGAERIATAHQKDDAVESHLLALERSGGLASLAGPRERRDDGIVRPLLAVSRGEILRFLAARGIAFRRDASNGNLRLSRNRVRRELARLRASPAGESSLAAIDAAIENLRRERRQVERDFEEIVLPAVRCEPALTVVDASVLARCPRELQRLALERLAAPYARPGRPPMTGRERERLLDLVAAGANFRFEAGRRVRFERRRVTLRVCPRDPGPVYDPARENPTEVRMREAVS